MNYNDLLDAYKQVVQDAVGTKDTVNSIDPTDVASIGLTLADLLKSPLGTINSFPILGGSVPPTAVANDLSLYFQITGNFAVWRYQNLVWTKLIDLPLGFSFGTGNISLQASVFGQVVSVSAGKWAIDDSLYSKATQTQLNLTPADANFNRIDLIVANTAGNVLLIDGIVSPTPAQPAIPANSVEVAYVYVPSISSGELPYIADSNSMPPTANETRAGFYAIPDTGQAIITIPHGYTSKPKHADAFPNNLASGMLGVTFKDWDDTNIYITLPFSNNDNQSLKYAWEATL